MKTHQKQPSEMLPSSVLDLIDNQSERFTSATRMALSNPGDLHEDVLEWLCLEHFQFSKSNPKFLQRAATNTSQLAQQGVSEELLRNFEEEKTHAEIYRRALAEIGTHVESRVEFAPTTLFLEKIQELVESDPSRILGAMYATETAAIFEHQVFRGISVELIALRNAGDKGKRLIGFHDMHLAGVEQAHKDNLGLFLRASDESLDVGRRIDTTRVLDGALSAIGAMRGWWNELLQKARGTRACE